MIITAEQLAEAGVEPVVVNGMNMFKRKDRLFLTAEHAVFGDAKSQVVPFVEGVKDNRRIACEFDTIPELDELLHALGRSGILHMVTKY